MDTLSLSGIINYVLLSKNESPSNYELTNSEIKVTELNKSYYIDVESPEYRCHISIVDIDSLSINRNILCAGDSCEVRISKVPNCIDTNKYIIKEISFNGDSNYTYLLTNGLNKSVALSFENLNKDIKKFLGGVDAVTSFNISLY